MSRPVVTVVVPGTIALASKAPTTAHDSVWKIPSAACTVCRAAECAESGRQFCHSYSNPILALLCVHVFFLGAAPLSLVLCSVSLGFSRPSCTFCVTCVPRTPRAYTPTPLTIGLAKANILFSIPLSHFLRPCRRLRHVILTL